MGKDTAIEWADSTLNFAWGCTKISEGCKFCYMYRNSAMYGRDPTKVEFTNFEAQVKKLKGYGKVIFVNSNSDTFHEDVPFETIDKWFDTFRAHPQHHFLVLTKRAKRMTDYFASGRTCPDNVWLGVSVEMQKYLWRIHQLANITSGLVKFVSFEPLLEKIEVTADDMKGINWAIIGGESGKDQSQIRRTYPEWAESLLDKLLTELRIPVFFKQWGGTTKCKCHMAWGCRLMHGREYSMYPSVVKISPKQVREL